MKDDNGEVHDFYFESFHNGHEALTLAIYGRASSSVVVVPSLAMKVETAALPVLKR